MTEQQPRCTSYVVLLAFGMLITGSANTVLSKILYDYGNASGCCGYTVYGTPNTEPHSFQHPWFQTWVMFVGELLCIVPYLIQKLMSGSSRATNGNEIVNVVAEGKDKATPARTSPFTWVLMIPAACDLTSSTLMAIALLWVPASIWQMMRGANIIFTGILSMIFLKAKLGPPKWLGMFLVVSGLSLVGSSGLLKPVDPNVDEDPAGVFLFTVGIILVLSAQLVAASQSIIEEKLLKGSGYEPISVVFMEGFWGVAMLSLVGLPLTFMLPGQTPVRPGTNFSVDPLIQMYSDNALDSFVQIYNNPVFLGQNIGILLSIACFNVFGLVITNKLTAVHKLLIDACRTILVWAALVVFGYLNLPFGEKLDNSSYLEGGGFVLLVLGTLIYNEVIKLPFFSYGTEEEKKKLIN
eukprot:TRINITY_DN1407_c0_g1_i1.p1 TRINITY_DN1407_c0_g1~~TRINITY_DN1407_c0_g1_i1.p1  ORF type:complete len:417 (+),score=79.18 TRINITY_DN1407_c0_g1_i1:25-1251(+)